MYNAYSTFSKCILIYEFPQTQGLGDWPDILISVLLDRGTRPEWVFLGPAASTRDLDFL